ncbi:hypothetical protein GCM10010924_61370 [Rhizobium wenxiniae]|nr:hypothetical protein GCM10010924_61370 [Rhizobium wenxiniae]
MGHNGGPPLDPSDMDQDGVPDFMDPHPGINDRAVQIHELSPNLGDPGLKGLAATMAGAAIIGQAQAQALGGMSFAQRDYRETFSKIGRQELSKMAGTPINTITDLSNSIKSGQVSPASVEVQVGTINGQSYIANTRSAVSLQRAGVPANQWNIKNIDEDKDAMARLRDQLERNGIEPGSSFRSPTSQSGEDQRDNTRSETGGFDPSGKSPGLW